MEDEPDVALLHGHIINALAANEYVTGGRHLQTGDHTEDCRLAAAAGSEQGHQLALFYRESDVVDGGGLAELFGDVLQFDAHV